MDTTQPSNPLESLRGMNLGNSEIIEVELDTATTIPNVDPVPLTGVAERTVIDEDNGRIIRVRRKRHVLAPDGRLVSDTESIVGHCVICREQGKHTIITKGNVRRCSECGNLICKDHTAVHNGVMLCPKCVPPNNARRGALLGLGLLALFGGALALNEDLRDDLMYLLPY